jgi:hypothetical protein
VRETIRLRLGRRDGYPLPESLRRIPQDRYSRREQASDDPRWGDTLEFCALQGVRTFRSMSSSR